ncbi:MAG: hypothetical protein K8R52_05900 [Bacteroidales bacterium]|nr:hypothetical protein [Bacteroidales bacterium]
MNRLIVTLIDVGWGDSIFIESYDDNGRAHYGLIDSNDTTYQKSSFIFLKRYFERKMIKLPDDKPIFDFIMLSHPHSDHGQGLKHLASEFGTRYFFYSKSLEWSGLATLLRYSNRSGNVEHAEAVNSTKILDNLGNTSLSVLWPHYGDVPSDNPNNNSIVLKLELGNVSVLLTGDAEKEVWENIKNSIPSNLRVFKVPHHGSVNGAYDAQGNPCWLNSLPNNTSLAISAHIKPFNHPHQRVIDMIEENDYRYYRTDRHYHVSFSTDGNDIKIKYSHFST